VLVCGNELIPRLSGGSTTLSKFVGPEAIEFVAVGVDLTVLVDWIGWDLDGDTSRYVLAIG
jgi:hypothetical protein